MSYPRWRGGVARLFASVPGAGVAVVPAIVASACRKQKRWARKQAGDGRDAS